jgi:5-methylcytosine-specific restriction endonuclease McrA
MRTEHWRKGKSPPNFQIKCLEPCLHCGKEKPRYRRELLKGWKTFCNSSCQIKWQNSNTNFNKGENNPSYEHGQRVKGRLPNYGDGFDKTTKRQVKIRDGYNCQECSLNFSGSKSRNLDVHHVDHNKYNNNLENLVSLCKKCHTQVHWRDGK